MPATKTEREFVNRVLSDLNVVGTGQDAEDEDFADVQGRLATLVAELNTREIVNLTDTSAIPLDLYEPLVEYVVLKVGPGYGRPVAPQGAFDPIEDRLREITRSVAPRRTLSTDPMYRQGNRWPRRFNFATGR
jgi:hypothetical protein